MTAVDIDNDPITYSWISSCAGTFNNATSQNPVFTADVNATYGACTLSVTTNDGRGGAGSGSLTILIAVPGIVNLAPEILSSFQAAFSVNGSGSLIFRIEARDPESSALTFNWTSNAGTMGTSTQTTTTNGTQSQVTWTASATTSNVQISVNVMDGIGLVTTYNFFNVTVNGFSWVSVASMPTVRGAHTSNLLSDGRVLVIGGQGSGGFLNTVEIGSF